MQDFTLLLTATIKLAAFCGIPPQLIRIWGVFFACLICSAIGVAISFIIFGTTITGIQLWGVGLIISVVMLGISYGAKYADKDAREHFTPVDVIQYLGQGFLWPTTWPGLADFLNVEPIPPPSNAIIINPEILLTSI